MPRGYSQNVRDLAIAANTEAISIYNKVSNGTPLVKIKRVNLAPAGVNGSLAAQSVEFEMAILGPTPTQNTSGASSQTPWQLDIGDSPSKCVVYTGATSLSVGVAVWEWDDGCYYFNGREVYLLELDLVLPPGYLFRLYFVSNPLGSPTINVDVEWTEEGT